MNDTRSDTHVDAIDAAKLTPLVRRAQGCEMARITDWHCQQIRAGVGAGTAVYRFTGQARDQEKTVPWSLVLKVLHPVAGQDDPSHWFYWKREAEAYRSGWLEDLPGSIAAPRCYGVEE